MKKLLIALSSLCFYLCITGCSAKHEPIEVIEEIAQKATSIYKDEMNNEGHNATATIVFNRQNDHLFWYDVNILIPNFEDYSYDEKLEAIKFLNSIGNNENLKAIRNELSIASIIFSEQIINNDGDIYECLVNNVGKDKYEIAGLRKNGSTYSKPKEPSKFEQYCAENKITLTAKDVQFDQENNRNKEFILKGTAEPSDYFNYGYGSNIEKNYFLSICYTNWWLIFR